MTTAGKTALTLVVLGVVAAGTVASVRWSQRDLVTVQTAKVIREDLTSIVTASGEIKPRNYINMG
ncbi:MAG TPA: secretion protein HlyD, partial [Bryobacteraceae bacterium]|nr:secretion protein HlyD [Bryobacteraceae bacterium]